MGRTADEYLAKHPELLDEDRISPRTIERFVALARPLGAYFRCRTTGFERVPAGGCLIVANHNAAAGFEVLLLLRAWRRHHGDRPARGLLHRIAWEPPFRWWPVLQRLGGIFAHPTLARRALGRGQALLVFPGGDLEATRPFSQRYRIGFHGRHGFVRLARETGVPIVPVVLCGSHASYVMLPGGAAVGRLLRMPRLFGFKSFPLTLGFVLVWAAVALAVGWPSLWPLVPAAFVQALLPLPSRIEIEVLEAIRVREDESDDEAAERIHAEMRASMDRMAAKRRTPWY